MDEELLHDKGHTVTHCEGVYSLKCTGALFFLESRQKLNKKHHLREKCCIMAEWDHLKIISLLIFKGPKQAPKCSPNVTWTYPCQRNYKDACRNLPHLLTKVKNPLQSLHISQLIMENRSIQVQRPNS